MSFLPVSRQIARSAFLLGGADIKWYRADFCSATRPDGTPCYNELRGEPWIECPVCEGRGVSYKAPRMIKGIYSENSDVFEEDNAGGLLQNKGTLTVEAGLDIRILKSRESTPHNSIAGDTQRLLRDKFEILGACCGSDGEKEVLRTVYLDDNTVSPYVHGGGIFQIVQVRTNHPRGQR